MTKVTEPGAGRIEGLDGLRAFAVIAVLVFHLRPSAVPGGFLGVDVFFVISGFLITTLLLRERARDDHIDLPGFWTRRARRLLPALLLVVSTSIAVASLVSSDLLVDIRRQVVGALTFSTNWIEIHAGADYFDDANRSLFVTFWSLAVEEQFYLLWPLMFVGLMALPMTAVARSRIALGIAAASALLMAAWFDPGASATRVYYGTDTHAFGLMIGVALAFAFDDRSNLLSRPRWQHLRTWVGFAAFAGLAALAMVVDSEAAWTYRGGIVAASLLTAVMVASLPGRPSAFVRVCKARPLAWIGERSYGIYLWHWPILVIVIAALPAGPLEQDPPLTTVVVVLGLTMAASAASFRWVEAPIRRDGFKVTWTRIRRTLQPRGAEPLVPRVALAASLSVVALSALGIATAPDKSAAQLSVERGERAIERQVPPSTPVDTSGASPPTSSSATTPADPTNPTIESVGAWPSEMATPPGDHIVALGDSVLSGAAPSVYERFPGIFIDATPILQWREAPAMVQAMMDAGTMRDVVILNFGTNAGLKDAHSEQALRAVLDALGPDRRVVLVTVGGVSYWIPETNDRMRAISAEYPNTIVADWYAIIDQRPGLLHSDRTHPTSEGTRVYADLLATALEDLGPS